MKDKKNNMEWGNSVRLLPWDDSENPDDLSTLDPLERMISERVHSWYDARHPEVPQTEIDFVNHSKIEHCPRCGGTVIKKNGFYPSGMQCYRCMSCGRKFSPLTNTIFDSHKIPMSEWYQYLLYLFEFHSLTTTARDSRNAVSTGKYWLLKVFIVLKDIQENVVLSGNIYFDEMFFPVVTRKIKRKNGKKLRGISTNLIAVAVALDDSGNMVMINEKTNKPSDTTTMFALAKHIQPGSHLVHDGENSHSILVETLHLTEEVHPTAETKGLPDSKNPLDPINNLQSFIRRYMDEHGGYARDQLQDWMNLVWFVLSEPRNRYEKLRKFINMAVLTRERLRYRDVMSKKSP